MLPVVRAMARLGATDLELAQALKVSVSAIELWARTHREFLRAVKPNKAVADDRVERSLYRRATGYSYDGEEVFTYDHLEVIRTPQGEGKEDIVTRVSTKKVLRVPVIKHVPPDTVAGIFWLKNRRKDRWRDFKATELSTPPGRPFEIVAGAPGEPELVGAYFARLEHQRGQPAAGGADGADPGADPGVDQGRQGTDRPRGDTPAGEG